MLNDAKELMIKMFQVSVGKLDRIKLGEMLDEGVLV